MTLDFEPAGHVYTVDGQPVPSVTQLLATLHSFAGVPLDVLETARERGTAVHLACQFHDESDLDEGRLDGQTTGYLEGWKSFMRATGARWTGIEVKGFHPLYRFAGTWDREGLIDLEDWTVDIKTAANPHWVWGLQLAAYNALRGKPGAKRGTVQLRPNGTYKFLKWTDPTDYPAFLSLVTLFNKARKHQ